jgi:phosphoribosylaminoimidazolecarboxamide formyltransferase / IMP cyclohydrolase
VRAVLSVYDKSGLESFARGLADLGYELVSTGGTHAYLGARGLTVREVSDVTGFPEILDGRVKTLHPAIHAGLLARRELAEHRASLDEHDIRPIDILAVNLYPFEATVSKEGCTLQDALDQIDIGGPAMLRAAAKNFPNVVVVTNPARYAEILAAIQSDSVTDSLRRSLATEAFQHVSTYDALVAEYLRGPSERFPDELTIPGRQAFPLRYGENPHQRASAYRRPTPLGEHMGILDAIQLQGKELSYNNILDSDAAVRALKGISGASCAIVKHAVPCGMATRNTIAEAFAAALASDPVSAFGGIVALNQPVDGETARQIAEIFFEVVIAPQFSDEARTMLGSKKRLRLLELPVKGWIARPDVDVRSISGGLLLQERDTGIDSAETWSVATTSAPSGELQADLAFAWHACRFVKSNAIVLVRDRALVGVGPGQPNRVDSVKLAIDRAGDRANGSVLASDAFFPFADGVEAAIRAGVAAIIQPGGSIRDDEVVAACNNAGVPMVFTSVRHFYH